MTASTLAAPAHLNGELPSSPIRSESDRNGSSIKKSKAVFPLPKSDSATNLDNPIMAIKPETKMPASKNEEKSDRSAESKVTAARNKNLDLAIQQIAKDYGDGAIMRL